MITSITRATRTLIAIGAMVALVVPTVFAPNLAQADDNNSEPYTTSQEHAQFSTPTVTPCASGLPALSTTLANYRTETNGFTGQLTIDKINQNKDAKWPGNTVGFNDCAASVYTLESEGEGSLSGTPQIAEQNVEIEPLATSSDTSTEVKGRGNGSWGFPKKSYQIKLGTKQDLLGLGNEYKSKKWILIPNWDDSTQLKNYLLYTLSREIGLYSPRLRPIEWWVDGEYRGLYWLTEKVEFDDVRVPGDKKSDCSSPQSCANAGGVLVEVDNMYGRAEPYYYQDRNNTVFVLKESKADDEGDGGMTAANSVGLLAFDRFKTKANAFEDVLFSGGSWNDIASKIDVDSFAEYYLLAEFAQNSDTYNSSTFMYSTNDNDKIHMGPLWDMGLSWNSYMDLIAPTSPFISTVANRSAAPGSYALGKENPKLYSWVLHLMKYPEFRARVSAAADTFTSEIPSVFQEYEAMRTTISAAQSNDQQRWPEELQYYLSTSSKDFNWVKTRADYISRTHGIQESGGAVFRVRNKFNATYFYTTNWGEVLDAENKYGWGIPEGIAFVAATASVDTTPVYRVRNKFNATYFYTTNWGEVLDAENKYGWGIPEGIAWNTPRSGTPLYRARNNNQGNYFYTTNEGEYRSTWEVYGWGIPEGIAMSVY
jgi:hypothetical protein